MRMLSVFILVFIKCLFLCQQLEGTIAFHRDEPQEALILTPLLEKNKISEAQERSRVRPDIGNIRSYSGYFTVNKECESNLFFWFFPAQRNWERAPLLLWLQGGPGASSMSNLFQEIGPITYEGSISHRQYSWNVQNNLLFIDQPVGTGFSFTNKGCFAENETVVGNELYSAMLQFYQLFPRLQNNKFYIAGHSYAGHFIPALGYVIHKNNPSSRIKINLTGMIIGNGWMDALYQYDLGSYLYQLGLIDEEGRDYYYKQQEQFLEHMKKQEWEKAVQIRGALVYDDFAKYVGNVSIFNYLNYSIPETPAYESFLKMPSTQKSIHVGNLVYSFYNETVDKSMGIDPVISVKPWVEELLEHYFIVFYNGQLDVVCAYPTTVNFFKALNWSGKDEFKRASRQKWCVNDQHAGYYKGAHNMYDVFVRNAGHMVQFDQPKWAYVLINSITSAPVNNPLQALTSCE